jgi:(p)ppGpp synthase/HD superfamily hydrolase
MDISKILRAVRFATKAHAGQYRKDGRTPYIVHPIEVAGVLSEGLAGVSDEDKEDAIIAALLHDTIEDTNVEAGHIEVEFGAHVRELVEEVSEDKMIGNRAARKAAYRSKLDVASFLGKSIKAADVMCNSSSVRADDPDFASIYLHEQVRVVGVLEGGDKELVAAAREIVRMELEAI